MSVSKGVCVSVCVSVTYCVVGDGASSVLQNSMS